MTKDILIRTIAKKTETKKNTVEAILNAYADVVLDTLEEDITDRVPLIGLGTFKGKVVLERKGTIKVGDKAGQEWVKPQHNELAFSISKAVKQLEPTK